MFHVEHCGHDLFPSGTQGSTWNDSGGLTLYLLSCLPGASAWRLVVFHVEQFNFKGMAFEVTKG